MIHCFSAGVMTPGVLSASVSAFALSFFFCVALSSAVLRAEGSGLEGRSPSAKNWKKGESAARLVIGKPANKDSGLSDLGFGSFVCLLHQIEASLCDVPVS